MGKSGRVSSWSRSYGSFTYDDDLLRIAHQWSQQGKTHWGIIYVHEQKLSVGECIRRLASYDLLTDPEKMKNRIEFL